MRIILDGMGGDNAPVAVVEGAVLASREMSHEIVITGDKELIYKELLKHKCNLEQISVAHAPEVITNDDAPVRAVRSKKNSSMVAGLNMLKEGKGDVFISAGNTGALPTVPPSMYGASPMKCRVWLSGFWQTIPILNMTSMSQSSPQQKGLISPRLTRRC